MANENVGTHRKVLWIDTDALLLEPYIEFLGNKGFEVVLCGSLSKGEELLRSEKYDLLILDVMLSPSKTEEDTTYDFALTNEGRQAGLVFFRRVKPLLEEQRIPILVFTQRLESSIRESFLSEGLPPQAFARKVDLPEVNLLFDKIQELFDSKTLEGGKRDESVE